MISARQKPKDTMRFLPLVVSMLTVFAYSVAAQSNRNDSLLHDARARFYSTHLPPGFDGSRSRPLLIVLHGGSGNAQSVQGFTRMNTISNANGFVTVYPQGFAEAAPGYSWADGRGTSADEQGVDDVGFIDALIDTLQAAYAIHPDSVYVCGFSNGGFMTQRLACEIPERFAAIGGLGCSLDTALINSCQPGQPVPMMYVSGTADPFVPYAGGEMDNNVTPIVPVDTAVQFWANNNNCQMAQAPSPVPDRVADDNSTVELLRFTDCDCEADVYLYRIINGGHTWPGVEIAAQEPILGETNEDISASAELWTFFSQFDRCDRISSTSETDAAPLRLYPNPGKYTLQIEASVPMLSVYLFDTQGRLVLSSPVKHQKELRLQTELPPGLYWVRIHTLDGIQYRRWINR